MLHALRRDTQVRAMRRNNFAVCIHLCVCHLIVACFTGLLTAVALANFSLTPALVVWPLPAAFLTPFGVHMLALLAKKTGWFNLDAPATPEKLRMACADSLTAPYAPPDLQPLMSC